MLFVHDHKFGLCNGEVYTDGALTDTLFKRYEDIFGKVIIFANKIHIPDASAMLNKITGKEVYLFSKKNVIGIRKILTVFKLVKSEKYIVLRLPSINCVLVGLAAIMCKKRFMVEVVGCPWDSYGNHSRLGKLIAPAMTVLTKYLTKRAAYALYVTDEFLQSRYPTRGKTIGCSDVILDDFDENVVIKPKKSKDETIILGTAAAIDVVYKGQEFVISAMAELKKAGIMTEYHLAGGGSSEYLEKRARERGVSEQVKFCGMLSRDKLNEFYKNLDIYIQPSFLEGMPRALIEAMSCGCYCIGSNVGGIPELIGNSNCFEKGNSAEVAKKIIQYFDDVYNTNETANLARSCDFNRQALNDKRNAFYDDFKEYMDKENAK